jgi:tetratricopeptide (TPR) repeat protein
VRRCRAYAQRSLSQLRACSQPPIELEAAILRLLGRVNIAQSRYDEAARVLEKGLRLLAEEPGQELQQVTAQGYLITAYGRLGRNQVVNSLARQLDVATRQLNSPSLRGVVLVQMGVAFNALDRWDEGKRWAEEGLQLCQEQELPVYVFVAKTVLGRIHYFQGERAAGKALLHEAMAWANAHDYWLFRFMGLLFLAEIAFAEGDLAALRSQVRGLQAVAERTGNMWALSQAQHLLKALEG